MKVLLINSVCGIRSTGRICTDIAEMLEKQGHECKIAYGRETVPQKYQKFAVKIGNEINVKIHALQSRFFDNSGFGSKITTLKFIEWVKEYDPDVIHLHNLHGYYLNIEILFSYLKTCGKKIIWTLHDCWSFTGHCAYFDFVDCKKWRKGCFDCPEKKAYPSSLILDRSNKNFFKKKNIFTNIPNMTVVTPSNWLKGLVKQSFLQDYPIKVINNGVDTSIFKATKTKILEKYGLVNKRIILGVASVWDRRKGLDYFIQLSKFLDDTFAIVVIGLNEAQIKELPNNILGIKRTESETELAQWYSAADIYINPTLEDNYPTTNLEAISCGTPVITFNTGGSGESATLFGKVIECDLAALVDAVKDNKFIRKSMDFSLDKMIDNYIRLYKLN